MNRISIRRRWHSIREQRLFRILLVILGIIVIGGVLVFIMEGGLNNQITGIGDAFYWAIITITTVGYGDKVPLTLGGKVVAVVMILIGFVSLSLFTATVASIFVERKLKEGKGLEQINLKGHMVVCGWNPSGEVLLRALTQMKEEERRVVLVNTMDEEVIQDLKLRYGELDIKFVRGDFVHESVLRRANLEKAASIIILADHLGSKDMERVDERTIIGLHTITYLEPKAKICAELMEERNKEHLRRMGVEDIIINSEYTGAILAATSQSPGISDLLKKALLFEEGIGFRRMDIPGDFVGRSYKELTRYFLEKRNTILLGLITEEKTVDMDDFLSGDISSIDLFIKQKFKEAGKDHLLDERKSAVKVKPPDDYIIEPDDVALVLA